MHTDQTLRINEDFEGNPSKGIKTLIIMNCEKVSIRFVGRGHPFHNSAMRGLRGLYREKGTRFAKQDGSDWRRWASEKSRVKRPMEVRTVFVAPLTIFTCDSYRMIVSIVCSRGIGDFEDRWKTKPGRKAKGEERSKFRAKLMPRLYAFACRL